MKITINGEKFEAYDYDDDNTILERYALSREIPSKRSFFRIINKNFEIKENIKLKVEDVRDVLKDIKQSELEENAVSISYNFPNLKKKDIGILWCLAHPKEKINFENFKALDRSAFLSLGKIEQTIKTFHTEIKQLNKEAEHKIKGDIVILDTLNKTKSIPIEQLEIEEIKIETRVDILNKENLTEIFDSMAPSEDVPFICLIRKEKRFFKVYTHIIPPDEWIEFLDDKTSSKTNSKTNGIGENQIAEGIYFKILNFPTAKLSSKMLFKNLYADGLWTINNKIEFSFKLKGGNSEEMMKTKFFSILGDRIKHKIIGTQQLEVRSIFKVKNFILEKYIFADLVSVNNVFKKFFFFDERNKTVMDKPRLYLHYANLGITITSHENTLSIRVGFAQNSQQANSLRNIFSKLLTIYNKEKDGIKKIYSSIIPGTEEKKEKKQPVAKVSKKTGKRALLLREQNNSLFGARYPDQCQKHQQPMIITEEEAQEAVARFEDPHKVMNYEGKYYICDPRDEDQPQKKVHLFPGLKENKSKIPEYREKHPLLPCCFVKDQYDKVSAPLHKYITGSSGPAKPSSGDYIVGFNKLVPYGRFGEMPYNWEKVFKYMGIEKVVLGKKKNYPILRQGVIETPKSFVHCLDKIFDQKYAQMDSDRQINKVNKILVNLSESIPVNTSKQETFDYSDDLLKEILLEPERYIDPDLFVSILEDYYNCNIFLYVVDSKHVNGDIVVPRHSTQAYLPKKNIINDEKPTVLIIKYETQGKDYPYQCEIVSSIKTENLKIKSFRSKFKSSSELSQMAYKLFVKANEVFIVSPDGYRSYMEDL